MQNQKIVSAACLKMREEGDDSFLVCTNEKGFETNTVGKRIIELCSTGLVFSDLAEKLAKEFDAPIAMISDDLRSLIPELVKNGIISYVEV